MTSSTTKTGSERHDATRRVRQVATIVGVALASVFLSPPSSRSASAQATIEGEVLVILASEAPGSIAPELAGIAALRQAPFSSYRSMTLLASHPISLVIDRAVDIPLPNGRVLQVVAEERLPDGRVRTRVSINRPGEHDYLPGATLLLPRCEPAFLAGQSFGGGTLVLGIRFGSACR